MKDPVISGQKAIRFVAGQDNLKYLIKVVYLSKTQMDLIEMCKDKKINYEIKDKLFFDNNFGDKTKYKYKFANAVLNKKPPISLKELLHKTQEKGIVVMLDHLQDPFNFGAILRTCAAAGISGIIVPKENQAPLNHYATLKASQGYALNLDIVIVPNLHQTIITLKKHGYWIYTTNINEDAKDFKNIKYEKKSLLIIGAEGDGVSPALLKASDFQIYIPMAKSIDSLNVSVATGIILFEMIK